MLSTHNISFYKNGFLSRAPISSKNEVDIYLKLDLRLDITQQWMSH